MTLFVGYEPARRCTAGPEPGCREFMSWFTGAYGSRGGRNLGIFNCRSVRGGSTTSLHGEGRACDLGINPHGAAYGDQLAEQLRIHSAELGIQCIIWKRRIWSGSYSNAGWRPYRGVNPHVDHLHVEFSRHAARTLTAQRVQAVLGGAAPVPPLGGDVLLPVLAIGDGIPDKKDTGPNDPGRKHWFVLSAQALINLRGLSKTVVVDGKFGSETEAAIKELQKRSGVPQTGKVDAATWYWLVGNDAPDWA